MQAFRSTVTVDEQQQLHLFAVPFKPGTSVEVIVLEPESPPARIMSPRLADPGDSDHFTMEVTEIREDGPDAEV